MSYIPGQPPMEPSKPMGSDGNGAGPATQVADAAKQKAKELAGFLGTQLKQKMSSQKDMVVDTLESLGNSMLRASSDLRVNGQSTIAEYAGSMAGQIERLTTYLKDKDNRELRRDVEKMVHDHPAAFVGTAFMLGVLAARFFKSSAETLVEEEMATAGDGMGMAP